MKNINKHKTPIQVKLTGDINITDEHEQIVSLITNLSSVLDSHSKASDTTQSLEHELKGALASLFLFIEHHFRHEEQVMTLYNYPDIEEHKKEHAQLLVQIHSVIDDLKTNIKIDSNWMSKLLTTWIPAILHSNQDQKLVSFLNNLNKKN